MIGLTGKRVLFIGIGFYDYEASIVARLRRDGAEVYAFFDRPEALRNGPLAPLLRRAGVRGLLAIRRHEQRMLAALGNRRCDYVLVIKGIDLRAEFLATLRARQPTAQFILYEWDSIARLAGVEDRLPYFDRILTFDRHDALSRSDFSFRPLFFREHAEESADPDEPRIDLCFVGWLHSDRLPMLRRLQAQARDHGLSFAVYLYTGLYTWLRLSLRGDAADVHTRPLRYAEVMRLNRRAAAIVDLPSERQAGLTMRAIETIGLGKKLITTAADVRSYDFYSPDRVQILDPLEPRLDPAFLEVAAPPLSPAVRRRYSLEAWLRDVFSPAPTPALAPAELAAP